MRRPADALVTGFTKSPALMEASFAPLRRLRQEGHLRAIHYAVWDDAEFDAFVAPAMAMDDVAVTRIPQPSVKGHAATRGVLLQIENLRAGLGLLPPDGLVLKLRPDFIANADLLRAKITEFETLCAPVARTAANGVTMPAPVFANKMWLPWADSSQPFFFEDAVFLATAIDARHLLTRLTSNDIALLDGNPLTGSYAHVVRYGRIFLGRHPLFAAYLRHYRYFADDIAYRRDLWPCLIMNAFFWILLIAHAWILHSQFHIDAGEQGDINFYANNANKQADWSDPKTFKTAHPYDNIAMWREGTHPGSAVRSVLRPYGRLVDDCWQAAFFAAPLADYPPQTIQNLMQHVATQGDGHLKELERDFYALLKTRYDAAFPLAKAG